MFIKVNDIINIKDHKKYDININHISFADNPFLKELNDIHGYIDFYYDLSDKLSIEYDLSYEIVGQGSKTPDDVSLNEHINDNEFVVFDENDDGFYIMDKMSDIELAKAIILPNVPIRLENDEKQVYYKGDGWTIISEDEYDKMKTVKEDPRLSVLKNYKEEK